MEPHTESDKAHEISKLSEKLLLCQQELARVREEQESWTNPTPRSVVSVPEPYQWSRTSDLRSQTAILASELSDKYWRDAQPRGKITWLAFIRTRYPRLARLLFTQSLARLDAEAQRVRLIEQSQHFDAVWYLQRYSDVATAGLSPAIHYLRFGAREGRNPGPAFNTNDYIENNPDVSKNDINPLVDVELAAPEPDSR